MSFQKGRAKTGGRQKGGPVRKATKFVDQLNVHRFNYPKELAEVLLQIKSLRAAAADPKTAAATAVTLVELKFYYNELKSLLPYMAPKLREKEVDTTEPAEEEKATQEAAVSNEDLLKVFDEPEKHSNPRTSRPPLLATRDTSVQAETRPEENLPNLAGESEADE